MNQFRQEEISSFLDNTLSSLSGISPEAAAGDVPPSLTLLRHGDEMGFRSTSGQVQAQVAEAEQRVRELMALPGFNPNPNCQTRRLLLTLTLTLTLTLNCLNCLN